jgi:hypothetical protein
MLKDARRAATHLHPSMTHKEPQSTTSRRHVCVWAALALVVPATVGFVHRGATGVLSGLVWGGLALLLSVSHLRWASRALWR